jgi:hypothetical protein
MSILSAVPSIPTYRASLINHRARAGMVWQGNYIGRAIKMMRIPGIRGLLLLLSCIAIVSCGKSTGDPTKSIDYMKIGNLLYADRRILTAWRFVSSCKANCRPMRLVG